MPVVPTEKWLYKYAELCEKQLGKGSSRIQCEIICGPLKKVFPQVNPEAVQYELLKQGLFESNEWGNIRNIVEEMEAQDVWEIVKQEYRFLRRLWNGPKVSIYIFPIKKATAKLKKQLPNRNGVAYKNALFLFLSPSLTHQEIKALLAHEYNHVCRLNLLQLPSSEISLKESLIVEGLGEYAVKELHGDKLLAPWVKLYSFEDALELWKTQFIPSLNILGVKNHHPFLYGKGRLPKWIGYHIGYQIVHTFIEKHGPLKKGELYTKSSDEIIAGSNFPMK